MPEWPEWWDWEVELIEHVVEQMAPRHFSEVDLRDMMEHVSGFKRGRPGRWRLETKFRGKPWAVIVEPDWDQRKLVVITAFEVYT